MAIDLMNTRPTASQRGYYFLIILIILFLLILFFGNLQFTKQNPGGNDFLYYWVGTHFLIYNGWSPYSEDTSLEIQKRIIGQPSKEIDDRAVFVYPFYSMLIFSPFALISDYTLARAFWMTFLQICLIFLTLVSTRLVNWKLNLWLWPIFLLFSILWYHGMRAIINGNVVIFVTLLIGIALLAINNKQDFFAGGLLAYATIKPNLVVLFVIFVFVWAISQRRWFIISGFFVWLAIFVGISMLFIPDWLFQNVRATLLYPTYTGYFSFGDVLKSWLPGIGIQVKWGLTIFLTFVLVFEWIKAWRAEFPQFLWTTFLTLTISQWIGITTDPGNFILLFLPLTMILSIIKERWKWAGDWIALMALIILLVGLWVLFLKTVEFNVQPEQHEVMFIPVPLFCILGLYWFRWWVIRPTRIIG